MQSTEEQIFATLQDVVSRLAALETAVGALTAKGKPPSKGIGFESISGNKVGHFVPGKRSDKPIDFSSIGGRKVGNV
jgi:hypothetical protein